MLDLGISKLAIIGVVALVVIGPEKLPRVARTVGALLGRAQRYISDVKAEVGREIQLDELRKMHETVRDAAQHVETTIHSELRRNESELNNAFSGSTPDSDAEGLMTASPSHVTTISPAKRQKWRRNVTARQSGTPIWFRQAKRRRTRVLSGAARVARYRTRSHGA